MRVDLVAGLPGSGKTTLLRSWASEGATVVDDIRSLDDLPTEPVGWLAVADVNFCVPSIRKVAEGKIGHREERGDGTARAVRYGNGNGGVTCRWTPRVPLDRGVRNGNVPPVQAIPLPYDVDDAGHEVVTTLRRVQSAAVRSAYANAPGRTEEELRDLLKARFAASARDRAPSTPGSCTAPPARASGSATSAPTASSSSAEGRTWSGAGRG